MARAKAKFVCRQCGFSTLAWLGRCPECQSWESFEAVAAPAASKPERPEGPGAVVLASIPAESTRRMSTGLGELDRVLGGGLTPGAVILLAGEPGVGKSTLLLQAAASTSRRGGRLLYVTGEESAAQVKARAERLGLDPSDLWVLAETGLTEIEREIGRGGWSAWAVDSIQTLQWPELGSPAGSPAQIRECAARLTTLAKARGVPLWLVGHITKDGQIAGPKLLEHLVDTVLYFEGERDRPLRILRSFKNRFGSVNETGVFEMTGSGLGEVANPSAFFLAERPVGAPGSAVTAIIEGHRPLMMEIQALVSHSPLAMPRRQTIGVDHGRVGLLAAVLEKKVRLKLFDRDIFVNVAGGARIGEPAADLAVAAAIASSLLDRPLPHDLVVVGEVGLAGEVRRVGRLRDRLAEAARLGFRRAAAPMGELGGLGGLDMEVSGVGSVGQLLREHLDYRGGRGERDERGGRDERGDRGEWEADGRRDGR
jgi:DNA repair protein RadA/Sms